MTITPNDTRDEYTATASQTVFSYTFKIYEDTDLNVYQTLAGATANDTTDIITAYTVTGAGDEDGGTITLTTGASAGDLITIVSGIPENRTVDYQTNGDFLPATVNDDNDRVVSLAKQTSDRVNRTLAFQESQQGFSGLDLPLPESQKYLRWKADLSGVENSTADGTVIAPAATRSTLTGNVTFTDNSNFEIILIFDPNGADRNITPSGVFADGFKVEVINTGNMYNLVFDPSGLGASITPGDRQSFIYLLQENEWR